MTLFICYPPRPYVHLFCVLHFHFLSSPSRGGSYSLTDTHIMNYSFSLCPFQNQSQIVKLCNIFFSYSHIVGLFSLFIPTSCQIPGVEVFSCKLPAKTRLNSFYLHISWRLFSLWTNTIIKRLHLPSPLSQLVRGQPMIVIFKNFPMVPHVSWGWGWSQHNQELTLCGHTQPR